MSEITTGSVPVSIVSAPLAVGAACVGAAYFFAQYCKNKHEKMLKDVEEADARLRWLDKQHHASPKKMLAEAQRLKQLVAENNTFIRMTRNATVAQKDILAGVIAAQNSPLFPHMADSLKRSHEGGSSFDHALKAGARNLASKNFQFVNRIVREAAMTAGFNKAARTIKRTETLLDIVFRDEHGRQLTAYCKINREMNPSLALDLEGFPCDTSECSTKMQEIVTYLNEHGVPFEYKRLKHNQPAGVLRNLLNKKGRGKNEATVENYLHSTPANPSEQFPQTRRRT